MGEIPISLTFTCMTRKPNKFAQDPMRKMKREINLPKNLPALERAGLDFVAAIFAPAWPHSVVVAAFYGLGYLWVYPNKEPYRFPKSSSSSRR